MLCSGCQITLATATEMVVNQKKGSKIGGESCETAEGSEMVTVEQMEQGRKKMKEGKGKAERK